MVAGGNSKIGVSHHLYTIALGALRQLPNDPYYCFLLPGIWDSMFFFSAEAPDAGGYNSDCGPGSLIQSVPFQLDREEINAISRMIAIPVRRSFLSPPMAVFFESSQNAFCRLGNNGLSFLVQLNYVTRTDIGWMVAIFIL